MAVSLKRPWLYRAFTVLFIVVVLIGCGRQLGSPSAPALARQSNHPSPSPVPPPTANPLPPTPEPTATAMIIPTPEATATALSPTASPTVIIEATATTIATAEAIATVTASIEVLVDEPTVAPTRSQQRPISTVYPETTVAQSDVVTPTIAAETTTISPTLEAVAVVVTATVESVLLEETDIEIETVTVEETAPVVADSSEPAVVAETQPAVASAEAIGQAGFTVGANDADAMDVVFKQAEAEVARYAATIDELSVSDCRELTAIYQRVLASPQFQPPEYRKQAYLSYLTSINSLKGGGAKITVFCQDWLNSAENTAQIPIPGDAVTSVNVGTSKSEYYIVQAMTQLQVFPVKATLVGSHASPLSGFWEIDLSFTLDEGVPPYAARVGGFLRQEGNRITILHTCSRDFIDHVSITDAMGQYYRSGKISASRAGFCN